MDVRKNEHFPFTSHTFHRPHNGFATFYFLIPRCELYRPNSLKEINLLLSSVCVPAGILAIAIVLGVAIVALLAVLGYCFLRGKKQAPQHQRVATNGTQVTTMEDTERLVYNTTTKAI